MLNEDIGNYIEIMELYLMLLSQSHQYEEVVTAIEGLLEDSSIPVDKLENFYRILHFNRKMMEEKPLVEEEDLAFDRLSKKDLHLQQIKDPQEQLILVAKLSQQNIQPYLSQIMEYLKWDIETAHEYGDSETLFFKTLLLNALKEHQIEHTLKVCKFGKTLKVIPKSLPDIYDNPQLRGIIEIIGLRIENDDPVLFDSIKELIQRHSFIIYPFPLEWDHLSAWAAAYHVLGNEYFGNNDTRLEMIMEYEIQEEDYIKADSFIRWIEGNSYTNI